MTLGRQRGLDLSGIIFFVVVPLRVVSYSLQMNMQVKSIEEHVRASAEYKLGVANQSITAGFFDDNTRLVYDCINSLQFLMSM